MGMLESCIFFTLTDHIIIFLLSLSVIDNLLLFFNAYSNVTYCQNKGHSDSKNSGNITTLVVVTQ